MSVLLKPQGHCEPNDACAHNEYALALTGKFVCYLQIGHFSAHAGQRGKPGREDATAL